MRRVLRFIVAHYLIVPVGVAMALVWASTSPVSYFRFAEALSFAVNDIGLAFAFAFLAQEVVEATLPGGTLHPWRRAALPLVAAAGGTLGAVAVYLAFIRSGDESMLAEGWPIAASGRPCGVLCRREKHLPRGAVVSVLVLLTFASNVIGLVLVFSRIQSRAAPGRGRIDRAGGGRRGCDAATGPTSETSGVRAAVRPVVLVGMLLERCPSGTGALPIVTLPAACARAD